MTGDEQHVLLAREAHALFTSGNYAKAIDVYMASFDAEPNAQSLRGIGECYSAMGLIRKAIIYFAASSGLRPLPKASFQLAEVLCQAGHLDEAKRAAERAIAAMPHYKAAHALLAEIDQKIKSIRHKPGDR